MGDKSLAREPDAEDDKNEPPQKLSLAFSTADVVVLGWSLGRLADKLRENKKSGKYAVVYMTNALVQVADYQGGSFSKC